ncbi:hypothetical protein KHQ89_04775 [Mycoplasmatota bacterium]|nr:hypothetical protein KHQ89_04775 [Mycoplasmatota bacterium]
MKLFEHIIGFIILSLGIVLVIAAELGAGSMDAFNFYVNALLSEHVSWLTLGRVAILNGVFVIILGFILSRDKKIFISFLWIFITGMFIDFWTLIVGYIPDAFYATLIMKFVFAASGVAIIGFGVALTLDSGYPPSPFEYLLVILDKKINNIAITKIFIDVTYLILAIVLGYLYNDIFEQIGLFTIVLTFFTGVLVKHFSNQIDKYKSKKGVIKHVIE